MQAANALPPAARRWARENLFDGAWNSVLTVVTAAALGFALFSLLRFVLVSADWTVVEANRRLLFVGRYPEAQEWRLWPPIWLLAALGGLSFGLWIAIGLRGAAVLAAALAFVFLLLAEGSSALLLLVGVALAAGGYALGRRGLRDGAADIAGRVVIAGWVVALPFTVLLLMAGDGVRTTLWGGLMLNLILATAGIAGGLPLGVLLALGRASSYPVVRAVSITYIELMRGAPLIAWLLMARFVLPDFMPRAFALDEIDIVMRAMLVLALFSAAYIAEIVRGGLQSLPRGQFEAAQAIGLSTPQTTFLIVLPQALRAVIPALVSQFISLFKDTSLVFVLSLTDLLGAAGAAVEQREFFGRQKETLLFVALLFWAGAFSMSRLSARLERRLGVGER